MYIPPHFSEPERKELELFIRNHSFGQLVSQVDGRLFVTPLPFLLNEQGTHLQAHMAYQNPQWATLEEQEALMIIQGQNGYVSPSLFTSPGVPTWNYQVLHVYGKVAVFHDGDEKHALVESLTRHFESQRPAPWEPEYPPARLKSIVGLEIEITEIQGKFKLSQNRPLKDQPRIAEDLDENGCNELAEAMFTRLKLVDDLNG